MPTSVLAAAAPALISGGLQFGLGKLFGGGQKNPTAPLQSFAPSGINAGGLSTTFSNGNINLAASPERLGFVNDISNTFRDLGGQISALRSSVAPGISELRSSRLAEIENARSRAIGDLRENLQRRRVLGSSFGQDTISRAEAEFGSARAKVAGESFLQELEASNQLLQQEFAANRSAVQVRLDELNLEANVAATLAGKSTETLGANARMMAQLNALDAQNAGKFFGQSFGPAFGAIGKSGGSFLSSLFGGGGGGGGMSPFGGGGFGDQGPTLAMVGR